MVGEGLRPILPFGLSSCLGWKPSSGLNLQMAWDLYHASRSPRARAIRQISVSQRSAG
jgi:plasmid maintenance system antidote protein VapI